jgi:hypothetical protein
MMAAPTHKKGTPTGTEPQKCSETKCEWMRGSEIQQSKTIPAMRRLHSDSYPTMNTAFRNRFENTGHCWSGWQESTAAARNLVPLPVPPGESRGGAGSPHAGSTLPANKKRWHASMLPAPPTRGLPPPCESPAEQLCRSGNEMRMHRTFTKRNKLRKKA